MLSTIETEDLLRHGLAMSDDTRAACIGNLRRSSAFAAESGNDVLADVLWHLATAYLTTNPSPALYRAEDLDDFDRATVRALMRMFAFEAALVGDKDACKFAAIVYAWLPRAAPLT